MKQEEVECAYCKKVFMKSIKKIKATIREGKKHACGRSCAAKISNVNRHSAPVSKNAEHTRRDVERYPEKLQARKLVRRAIKKSLIEVPEECEACQLLCDKLEAHHPDHDRPYWIVFVCKDCHAFLDKYKTLTGEEKDYSDCVIGGSA